MVAVRQGKKFSPRYVTLLEKMVLEHAGVRLITLTDEENTPGDTLPLQTSLRGWWAKMELFAPWNEALRPCLYFDLDTFILGDIRDLLHDPGDSLSLLRDLFNPKRSASGIMIIPRKTDVWDKWTGDTSPGGGDQQYIATHPHRKLQDEYPGIVSYKADVLNGRKGRIVCFHGKPKPHECNGWAGDIWVGLDG